MTASLLCSLPVGSASGNRYKARRASYHHGSLGASPSFANSLDPAHPPPVNSPSVIHVHLAPGKCHLFQLNLRLTCVPSSSPFPSFLCYHYTDRAQSKSNECSSVTYSGIPVKVHIPGLSPQTSMIWSYLSSRLLFHTAVSFCKWKAYMLFLKQTMLITPPFLSIPFSFTEFFTLPSVN